MVPPVNEPTPEHQQNEPETPQSESTIPIDGDNAPTKHLKQKGKLKVMKLMLSNLNFIHLRHAYSRKQKLVLENGHFMPTGVKTTLGCIITQKKM